MASHLRVISFPTCFNCGKKATHELYNTVNARCGSYCRTHAYIAPRARRILAGEPAPTKEDMPS